MVPSSRVLGGFDAAGGDETTGGLALAFTPLLAFSGLFVNSGIEPTQLVSTAYVDLLSDPRVGGSSIRQLAPRDGLGCG